MRPSNKSTYILSQYFFPQYSKFSQKEIFKIKGHWQSFKVHLKRSHSHQYTTFFLQTDNCSIAMICQTEAIIYKLHLHIAMLPVTRERERTSDMKLPLTINIAHSSKYISEPKKNRPRPQNLIQLRCWKNHQY